MVSRDIDHGQEQTSDRVRFNRARKGATFLESKPPFDFRGVVMRVFPLRANIATLTGFCRDYLNFLPPEIAHFQPASPYVLVAVINYGSMESAVQNVGWVAQDEIVFSLLLEWYRYDAKTDRLVFQDWVSFSPFIYVNSEISEVTGRAVYGWPKEYARMEPQVYAWAARGPRSRRSLMSLTTRPPLAAGAEARHRRFLEILHSPPPTFSMIPPSPRNEFAPWVWLSRATVSSLAVLGQSLDLALGLPVRGYPTRTPEAIAEMTRKCIQNLTSSIWIPGFNTVNLKQFRAAGDPKTACYQALINARMEVTRFNRGGLLADPTLLSGDRTAGFRLHLMGTAGHNIARTLGLEVDQKMLEKKREVVVLEPWFPYWLDLDIRYARGQNLGWRVPPGDWHVPAGDGGRRTCPPRRHDHGRYRTARRQVSGALLGGPLGLRGASFRVLPLLADRETLDAFCRHYLKGRRFRAWGSFVLLIAASVERVVAQGGEIIEGPFRKLVFAVPIREVRDGKTVGLGLTYPFSYAGNDILANWDREVFGIPTVRATLESPRTIWMDEFQPVVDRAPLLSLVTEVLPALYPGQEMVHGELLQIFRSEYGTSGIADQRWHELWQAWLERIREAAPPVDVPESVRAAARRLERGESPICERALKQFRGAAHPSFACYQSRVHWESRLLGQPLVRPFRGNPSLPDPSLAPGPAPDYPTRLWVSLERYPNQPIREVLGLVPFFTDDSGRRETDYLLPVDPFWISGSLQIQENAGETLLWPRLDGTGPRAGAAAADLDEVARYQPVRILQSILSPAEAPGGGRQAGTGQRKPDEK